MTPPRTVSTEPTESGRSLEDQIAWAILQSLHENVSDGHRPQSWSDMNGEQEKRIRSAARAAMTAMADSGFVGAVHELGAAIYRAAAPPPPEDRLLAEAVKALEGVKNAWEKPNSPKSSDGVSMSIRKARRWLIEDMKPAMDCVRTTLTRLRAAQQPTEEISVRTDCHMGYSRYGACETCGAAATGDCRMRSRP